jgi:outer membrane protein OmpA-like peptidoglycan-associated protein
MRAKRPVVSIPTLSSRAWLLTAAMLCVALAPAAHAQRRGTIDLGAFWRGAVYDTDIGIDDAAGLGGRLGWYFADHWILEGDAGLIPTRTTGDSADIDNIFAHGRLLSSMSLGSRTQFLLGVGYAFNQFGDASDQVEHGVGGLAGFRLRLTRRLAVRVDASVDYMLAQANNTNDNLHAAAYVGASLLLFAGPPDRDNDMVADNIDRCLGTPEGTPVEATGCPDTDRDGVANTGDRCANTAAGLAVDAVGCTDGDNDGVVDPQDRCASTAAGTQVDATGCPADADRDGVLDAADRCLGTPAGSRVDGVGCPVAMDADADGVVDGSDRCPATPRGGAVDAAGCPVAPVSTAVVLEGVSFLSGSAKLTLDSQEPLNNAASRLAERPDLRVVIEGHTDNVGNRDANIRLSKARAEAVRTYLASKGIARSRMTTVGHGPDQPVASNETAEGRARNRRVQLRPQQ